MIYLFQIVDKDPSSEVNLHIRLLRCIFPQYICTLLDKARRSQDTRRVLNSLVQKIQPYNL